MPARVNDVSELVGVEYPAFGRGSSTCSEFRTERVKLLHLLGDEPYDGIWVGAQLQDSLERRPHVHLLYDSRRSWLFVEDATPVRSLRGIVDDQDHLRPRRHHPGHVLQLIHYPPSPVDFPLQLLAYYLSEPVTFDNRVSLIPAPLGLLNPPTDAVEIQ